MKRLLTYLSVPMLLIVLALGVQLSFGSPTVKAQDIFSPACADCDARRTECLTKAKTSVDVAKCEADFQKCTAEKCPDPDKDKTKPPVR